MVGKDKCQSTKFSFAYWTPWFDVDDPWNGFFFTNDDERVTNIQAVTQKKLCKFRTNIEARLTNGLPYIAGGNYLSVLNANDGLLCVSAGQKCRDYKVRFCCRKYYAFQVANQLTHGGK